MNSRTGLVFARTGAASVLLILFGLYESAPAARSLRILLLGAVFIGLGIVKTLAAPDHDRRVLVLALLEVACLLVLESQSRYLINYFSLLLYLLLVAEDALLASKRTTYLLQGVVFLAANQRWIRLLSDRPRPASLVQAGFFLILMLLVAVLTDALVDNRRRRLESQARGREILLMQERLGELARTEERERMAREIHDSLGHDLTSLIMELEMARHQLSPGSETSRDRLSSAIVGARDSLRRVRRLVEALREEPVDPDAMLARFAQRTGLGVEADLSGWDRLNEERRHVLYRVLQESLTNAVRHARPSQVRVVSWVVAGPPPALRFEVSNDGLLESGCTLGNGLRNMRDRLASVNGSLAVRTDTEFRVKGEIPIADHTLDDRG